MIQIGNILTYIFRDLGIEDAVKLKFLRKNWEKIFESPVSNHTFPKDLKEDTLLITVDSNIWLNELILMKTEVLKRLNKFGIKDVEFKFGKIPQKYEKKSKEKNISINSSEQEWIKNIVSNFKDIEVKDSIECALKKSILFNKKQGV